MKMDLYKLIMARVSGVGAGTRRFWSTFVLAAVPKDKQFTTWSGYRWIGGVRHFAEGLP